MAKARSVAAKKSSEQTTSKLPQTTLASSSTEKVRANFLLPVDLHRRVKIGCANEDISMTDVLISFLEKRFPKK